MRNLPPWIKKKKLYFRLPDLAIDRYQHMLQDVLSILEADPDDWNKITLYALLKEHDLPTCNVHMTLRGVLRFLFASLHKCEELSKEISY